MMKQRTIIAGCAAAFMTFSCGKPADTDQQQDPKPQAETSSAGADWPRGPLPRNVIPLAYRLDLTIIPDEPRFSGRVEIDIDIREPLQSFWIHGRDLNVTSVALDAGGEKPVAGTYAQVSPDGVARVDLESRVEATAATLLISYDAAFGDGLSGLYKVTVGGDDYAFTQFESIYARQAFPCFDEPAFKTPFETTVTTRDSYEALSNTTAGAGETLAGGLQRIRYRTTEPLPTYLIAFAVGPLDVVEWDPIAANPYRRQPLPLRGVAARGKGDQLNYALENTGALVTALEEYFASPYPFDKLDIVAVPDFAGGAMENVGLITYRESILLFDESPPVNQERFLGLIHAHELGHQWFGNLVTMPWWDDIWLNEAFAAWIQAKIAQVWRPEFRYEQSVQAQALRAMANDSLVSARQIRQPVNDKDDIISAFDAITYQKGAAVLQMFERYLGEETFQAGLQTHMERFAWGSATVYDLLDSLETVKGEDQEVREPFETFLFQPGLPYVGAAVACSDGSAQLTLTQERYLPLGSAGERDKTWKLPVCLTLGHGAERTEQCVLLTEPRQTYQLATASCPDWILPNAGGAGYFRWHMPREGMSQVSAGFLTHLDAGERLSYVDSVTAGVRNGSLSPEVLLNSLDQIAASPERYPIDAAVAAYQGMLDFLVDSTQGSAARELARGAFLPRLRALEAGGGALSDSDRALLTARLTNFMALWLDDQEIRRRLQEEAQAFLGYPADRAPDPGAVDPDLLTTALTVAVQEGDGAFLDFFLDYIRENRDARVRQSAVTALAYVKNPDLLDRARQFALGPDLRANELQTWVAYMLNSGSRAQNWPWVQDNINTIMAAGSQRVQRELPVYLARGLCAEDDAVILEARFTELGDDFTVSPRRLSQAVESVRLCAAYRDAQSGAANDYFSGKVTDLDRELSQILALLPGRYEGQAVDPNSPDAGAQPIYHKIAPIQAPQFGEQVFYYQLNRDGFDGEPLQRKVFVFDTRANRTENRMRPFILLPEQSSANLEQDASLVAALQPELLFSFPEDCDFVWSGEDSGYRGRVNRNDCEFQSRSFGQVIQPDMSYSVTRDKFTWDETLYGEDGEPVVTTGGALVAFRQQAAVSAQSSTAE